MIVSMDRYLPVKLIFIISLLGMNTLLPAAVIEGDSGFFYQDAYECFAESQSDVSQSDIYVATDGDDDNDGLSRSSAFATLSKALCSALPGQTIHIASGTYIDSVMISQAGAQDKAIKIVGPEDGEAVFDGQNYFTFAIALIQSSNIEIHRLHFKNYTDEAVLIALSKQMRVQDSSFTNNGRASIEPDNNGEGFGINILDSADVLIENNRFEGNGPTDSRIEQGILGTAINSYRIRNAQIRGNQISNTRGGGILIEDGMSVVVENNSISNSHLDAGGDYWDGAIWLDGGYRLIIRNNQITNNQGPAIQISDADKKYPYASCRYRIENNTITDNYWAYYLHSWDVCPLPSARVATFVDNQVRNNDYPQASDEERASTFEQTLCYESPCGEGQSCTQDSFDQSIALCEVDALYSFYSQRLYLSDIEFNGQHFEADLRLQDAQKLTFNIDNIFLSTQQSAQPAAFQDNALFIPEVMFHTSIDVSDNTYQPVEEISLQYLGGTQFQLLSR